MGQELSELSRDGDNSKWATYGVGFITLMNIAYIIEQQVINLLRERLEMTTGELVEQKERADAFEAKQARNVKAP